MVKEPGNVEHSCAARKGGAAVTAVEFLVVIAILAATLLPALSKWKPNITLILL